MGPGRLTGMNGRPKRTDPASPRTGFNGARSIDRDERPGGGYGACLPGSASMGPGRLTGMNDACHRSGGGPRRMGFNGARSIDRDERGPSTLPRTARLGLQWGPVD